MLAGSSASARRRISRIGLGHHEDAPRHRRRADRRSGGGGRDRGQPSKAPVEPTSSCTAEPVTRSTRCAPGTRRSRFAASGRLVGSAKGWSPLDPSESDDASSHRAWPDGCRLIQDAHNPPDPAASRMPIGARSTGSKTGDQGVAAVRRKYVAKIPQSVPARCRPATECAVTAGSCGLRADGIPDRSCSNACLPDRPAYFSRPTAIRRVNSKGWRSPGSTPPPDPPGAAESIARPKRRPADRRLAGPTAMRPGV